MSSSIFSIKIYWSLHISILIPSHENGFFIERKSSNRSMSIDLDRSFSCINRLPYIGTFSKYRNCHTTCEFEIFIRISVEIFIFIYTKERSILGIYISRRITLIVLEDKWNFWKLEILRNREHLIIKPGDNR